MTNFEDSEIMLGAAAALGRSHAERGFDPYWQAIFPKRQAAYIRAYNERKAELNADLPNPNPHPGDHHEG